MINVEYEFIELKDGKRIESRVFYELHTDNENYKEKLNETLNCILDTTDNLSYIGFGLIRNYRSANLTKRDPSLVSIKNGKKGDD